MMISLIIVIISTFNIEGFLAHDCPNKCTCEKNNKYVSCKGKKINSIPNNIPRNVENLDLSQNVLTSLPPRAFVNLSNLQDLNLGNNQIVNIYNDSFEGLISLKHLYLMNNHISELQNGTFSSLRQLLHLHLSNNNFNHVPVVKCPTMTRLNLANNQILNATFPVSFKPNRSLRNIILTNNMIYNIDQYDLQSLEDSGLQSMILTKNNLEWVHARALRPIVGSLTTLKLDGNTLLTSAAIEELLKSFDGSTSLNSLDLKNTGITNISSNFFQPLLSSRLSFLDLSSNSQLVSIHENSFQKLRYVQRLYLDNCNLLSLSFTIGALESLREIRLNNNNLGHCPNRLPHSLQMVDISNNRIVSLLKQDLSHLYSLKSLVVSSNIIANIEEGSFSNLGELTSLDLSYNSLENVQYSDLSNNSVISKKGMFVECKKMSSLNLSHNKIRGWSPITFLDPSSALIVIDLSFNSLIYLSTMANENNYIPQNFNKIWRFYLYNNPWNCTCRSVYWMLSNKYTLVKADEIVCESPNNLKGRKLFEISELKNCSQRYTPLHPGFVSRGMLIKSLIGIGVIILITLIILVLYFRKRLSQKYKRWTRGRYRPLRNPTIARPTWIADMKASDCVADECVLLTQKAPFEVGRLPVRFIGGLDLLEHRVAAYHCLTLVIDLPVCGGEEVTAVIVEERLREGGDERRTFVFHGADLEHSGENSVSILVGPDNVREYSDLVTELYTLY